MTCGPCEKRRLEFEKGLKKKKIQEQLEKEVNDNPEINNLSKKHYDPDKDPNYKLTKQHDSNLKERQKRIKHRILRMEQRAMEKAVREYKNKSNN